MLTKLIPKNVLLGEISIPRIVIPTIPEYEGQYIITPSTKTQILQTQGKQVLHDIQINPIPQDAVTSPNYVVGTFRTPAQLGSVEIIQIPYHGYGYPISGMVYVSDGLYGRQSDWKNRSSVYSLGCLSFVKNNISIRPDYIGNSETDLATINYTYGISNNISGIMNDQIIYDSELNNFHIIFLDNNILMYSVVNQAGVTTALAEDKEYTYCILYSE